jgi:D-3-phosphoglycerate dehydrogenase
VPLTDATRHLIDRDSIAGMTRAPLLVNTSRGALVDLDAALEALDDGRLGGIALDVTEIEPPPADHRLRDHPRAVITPHMAFYSVEAQADLQRRAADEVARALTGRPPQRPLNPELLTAS